MSKNHYSVSIMLIFITINFNCFSQLAIREIANSSTEILNTKLKYDTLSNIKYHENLSDYSIYIGQKILFYPRNASSNTTFNHYGNFYLKRAIELTNEVPDTIWQLDKRQKKRIGYQLKFPFSDRYKPTLVLNKHVSFGNKSYNNDTLKSGYFTPAKEIEGKVFKIIDFNFIEGTSHSGQINKYFDNDKSLLFTLVSESNDTVIWQSVVLYKYSEEFPCIIVSFYENIKSKFIGNSYQLNIDKLNDYYSLNSHYDYYASNIDKGGKYTKISGEIKCLDMNLVGNKNEYMVPKLIFKTIDEKLIAINITNYPSLKNGSYHSDYNNLPIAIYEKGANLKFENDSLPENLAKVCSIDKLIDIKVIKEKVRIEHERTLAETKIQQLESEKYKMQNAIRHKTLIKKYGKHYADLIIKGLVEIGMSKNMCIESWGNPEDINKTIGNYGVHEQWVYGDGDYLYFEDGKLTTIQN